MVVLFVLVPLTATLGWQLQLLCLEAIWEAVRFLVDDCVVDTRSCLHVVDHAVALELYFASLRVLRCNVAGKQCIVAHVRCEGMLHRKRLLDLLF